VLINNTPALADVIQALTQAAQLATARQTVPA